MYITMKQFTTFICEGVKERLGPEYKVEIIENVNVNNHPCHRLIAYKESKINCPAIVLEDAYTHYRHGVHIDDVCTLIAAAIKDDDAIKALDTKWYLDYDRACDRICYRLISRERNEEYLKDKPFIPFLDLAIIFYAPVIQGKRQIGTITVTYQHLQAWGVTVDDLMHEAELHTSKLYHGIVVPHDKLLESFKSKDTSNVPALLDVPDDLPEIVFVATNRNMFNGASVLLYDDFLKKISESLEDFYILIPSVNEAYLIPALDEVDESDLLQLVEDMILHHLNSEEVLSDHLYKYDYASGELTICK